MVDRLKSIPSRFVEIWKKLTTKQRMLIISVVAVVFMTFIVLYYVFTKIEYTKLYKFEDTQGATGMIELLEKNSIPCRLETDKLTVSVDCDTYQDALVLMGTSDIPEAGMSWDEALNNKISTGQTEKEQKINLAFQNDVRKNLLKLEYVKDAAVYIQAAPNDSTIFAENEDTSVSVMLTLKEQISEDAAAGIGKMLAGAVGNKSTEKITIIDSNGRILFSGEDDETLGGNISSANDYKVKLRNTFRKNVKDILLSCNYDDVKVSAENLQFNMDKVEEMYTIYEPAEGQDQGLYKSTYDYSATGSNIAGGVPGTDSNDESVDYDISTNGGSDSEVKLNKADYLPNTRVKNIDKEVGAVDPSQSSIGVVLTKYKVYNQATVEKDGALGELTWDEFVEKNNDRVQIDLDDGILNLISQVTGVSQNKIAVTVWEQPIFNDEVKSSRDFSNYIMIILAVLIVALLVFVLFRSLAPVKVTETEPELSVEELLATTKDSLELDDIEVGEDSETRRLIEKFVDENPEAAAHLLRNWLNEDWG